VQKLTLHVAVVFAIHCLEKSKENPSLQTAHKPKSTPARVRQVLQLVTEHEELECKLGDIIKTKRTTINLNCIFSILICYILNINKYNILYK
jgi:hypothetical protein